MNKVKALIFDWHGVLDETKFELLLDALSQLSGMGKEDVKLKLKSVERAYAQGSIKSEEFWNTVQQELHLDTNQVRLAQETILSTKLNYKLWQLLPVLAKKYRLAILSDCPEEKVEIIRRDVDLGFFDAVHFSAEKRLLKDSDTFFLNLVADLQLQTNECLYIDDSEKHIVTAKRLGFEVCHFKDIRDLGSDK